jgi:hypothetical protein
MAIFSQRPSFIFATVSIASCSAQLSHVTGEHDTYAETRQGIMRRGLVEQRINRQVAVRVYTNRDVAQLIQQLSQSTGFVKYGGKTEIFVNQ